MNYSGNSSHSQDVLAKRVVSGLRSLFYLWTPGETSYRQIEDVPEFVDKAPPYFFLLIFLEIIVLHLQGRKDRLPRCNDAFSSLAAGVSSQIPLLVMRNVEIASYIWLYNNYCIYPLSWDSPWTWILSMFGVDLGYYWVHRFAHEVNFMWAGHQTHHSSEDYNLTTALRQGIFQKYSSWIFYLPMAFFIPPSVFAVHIQFNLLFQFWIHTETIGKIGPLEYILNTPSHHRVHHGINRYCIDRNYAGVFIIWDRMFGTFEPEKDPKDIVYGLVHQVRSWNPIYTQISHWLYILKSVYEIEGIGNKISVLVKSPGWEPGKPRLGYREDIPDVHAPAVKFDKSVSNWLSAYCMLQFVLMSLVANDANLMKEILPTPVKWLGALWILWCLTSIGALFESRSLAPYSIILQWIVFLLFDSYVCAGSYGTSGTCPRSVYLVKFGAIFSLFVPFILLMRSDKSTKAD